MTSLTAGLTNELNLIVQESDTAASMTGGELPPVLGTPRLIQLLEQTARTAVATYLAESQTTVGALVNVRHLAATPVGMKIRTRAELLEVDGRRLRFRVEAWDEVEKIAEGEHERFVIDEERFRERLEQKRQKIKK